MANSSYTQVSERGPAGGYVHVGDTPPTDAFPWDLWFHDEPDSDTIGLYVLYKSQLGEQWVEISKGLFS